MTWAGFWFVLFVLSLIGNLAREIRLRKLGNGTWEAEKAVDDEQEVRGFRREDHMWL